MGSASSSPLVGHPTTDPHHEHALENHAQATKQESIRSNSDDHLLSWQGAWHFEQTWFREQHPWLPNFLVQKVLESTLILGQDSYHQVDQDGKAWMEQRSISVLHHSPNKAELVRYENSSNKQVKFHLEKRDDNSIYYCEEKKVYRLKEAPHPTEPSL
jgi:hypothetical protein